MVSGEIGETVLNGNQKKHARARAKFFYVFPTGAQSREMSQNDPPTVRLEQLHPIPLLLPVCPVLDSTRGRRGGIPSLL